MAVTDLQLAELLVLAYDHAGSEDKDLTKAFDYYDPGNGPHGVHLAVKYVEDETLILLPGSYNFWDWAKDGLAFVNPWNHDTLGPIHPGFDMGMERLAHYILDNIKGNIVLSGHSLGAGRGWIVAALLKELGRMVKRCVFFGSPKPGFASFAGYVRDIPSISYVNVSSEHEWGHDGVTDVPFYLPPADYVQPIQLTHVSAEPDLATIVKYTLFRYHHMPLYAQALSSLASKV